MQVLESLAKSFTSIADSTSWDFNAMVAVQHISAESTLLRIQQIQVLTIVWMSVEAGVSLSAAWRAKSPALLAFGGDSGIELLSAVIVLWRFRNHLVDENAERRAARVAGSLLLALAVLIVASSGASLLGYSEPKLSYLGIAVLVAAGVLMPWLARQKRALSSATQSAALRADAAESMLCAYLSWIALIGLAAHAYLGAAWADPVAALVIVPLVAWEGREALRGKACGCC
ncbi:MAG: cation transporter [Candidatus Sulfotelmatobacter sp.]